MPHIDTHPEGAFCWVELATTAQEAAKTFYSGLFGWEAFDSPLGPGEVYTMFRLEGRDAAAAYTLNAQQREKGIPPHWLLYVSVADADAKAERVAAHGGAAIVPPFDVMDYGRMAVVQDPTGAVFSLWQGKSHKGTGITGSVGTLCWADLMTRDPARAITFYTALLGWEFPTGGDPSGYRHIQNGGVMIGGVPPAGLLPEGVPPHWLPYFAVADCAAAASRAAALGGRALIGPLTIEKTGRMAVIADPQGAAFALFEEFPRQ